MSESVRETELAMVTLASIGEGVIRTDASGRVDYMNPVAEKLTGWPADDASGRDITEVYQVVDESTRRSRRSPVEMCLSERRTLMPPGLFTLRARTGDEFTIRDTISPLLSAAEELLGVVLVFRDLTRVRSLEREMAYITSHDTLTGLLNRQDFEIYVEAALEGTRVRKERHSLLHLDLMELKLVNDCYGHVAGDELLRQMAELMRASVGDWAVIARIGGGDFCLLLENHDTDRALDTAKTLQGAVSEFRFSWGGQYFEIGFNVGVVALDSSTESVSHALKAADTASYQARQRGRNKVQVHGAAGSNSDDRHSRLHWVQRIRQAIAGDRFRLFHQRIEPLGGGSVTHEILLRMVGDEGEIVSPGAFIPIAESYDLASLIDRWVVRRSVRLLSRDGVLGNAPVSLNLSGQSLGDEGFLEDLLGYLRMGLVDPARLRFEVTETHAVAHLGRARRFLGALRELGCRIVLDDFGSGFSSFGYLRNLPVDVLKIDGTLVRDMANGPIPRAMVGSINQIAHLMGLETIAEWVENDELLGMARDAGSDFVQGYCIHRPEPLPGQD